MGELPAGPWNEGGNDVGGAPVEDLRAVVAGLIGADRCASHRLLASGYERCPAREHETARRVVGAVLTLDGLALREQEELHSGSP